MADDPEQLRTRIAQAWSGVPDTSDPNATIKSAAAAGAWARRLSVRPRRLARDGGSGPVDYELAELIGTGGMGVVHAGRQAALGRTVAIKLMRSEAADDPDKRARFLAEALVTGNLEHPNIVPVYELGVDDDGALFYAMKRVLGQTWKDALPSKPLADNVEILLRVCDAIGFAHARGIVHCDLKPANVMLGDHGETLVMDWGLAVAIAPDGPVAIGRAAAIGGTPAYMAPELALFDVESVSPATDVYLLCAILYEILTGRPPHDGASTNDCLLAAATNHIVLPEKPIELVDIAARGLLTDPRQRWPSVAALAAALRGWRGHAESLRLVARAREHLAAGVAANDYDRLARAVFGFEEARALWSDNAMAAAGESEARIAYARSALANDDLELAARTVRAHVPSERPTADAAAAAIAAQRAHDAYQRRFKRLSWAIVEASAAALVIALVIVVAARADDRRERDAARAAHAGEARARAAAEASAYAARLGVAEAWLASGRRDEARSALDACDAARRGWEWRRLDRVEQGGDDPLTLCRRDGRLAGACAEAAIVALDRRLVWLDPATGRELRALELKPHEAPSSTAGGALVRGDGVARLFDAGGVAVGDLDAKTTLAAIAPRGAGFAAADAHGALSLPEAAAKLGSPACALAWSGDGRWLAVAERDGRIELMDARGRAKWTARLDGPAQAVAIADRAGAVVALRGEHLTFLALADGAVRMTQRAPAPCACLEALPDGDRIASGDVDGRVVVWDAVGGAELARIAAGSSPILALRVAADALVAQDAQGRIVAWRGGR